MAAQCALVEDVLRRSNGKRDPDYAEVRDRCGVGDVDPCCRVAVGNAHVHSDARHSISRGVADRCGVEGGVGCNRVQFPL